MSTKPGLVGTAIVAGLTGVALVGAVPALAGAQRPPAKALQPSTPTSATIPGTHCQALPASSIWHADVSRLPVNRRSVAWLANTAAASTNLHPDFGPAYGEQPVPYGIPITISTAKTPSASVGFDYADESDQRKYPLDSNTKIEGGNNADGDRHAIVVHAPTCTLYETYDTHFLGGQRWHAGSGAVWNLQSNALRRATWTSADAAGLPIMPGLLRWDEVAAGRVDHAIRFTVSETRREFIWPARHQAGSTNSASAPPMGAWFRMRKSFDDSGFSARGRVVLAAMKIHGMIVADNGSDWYFTGTSDSRWPSGLIEELKRIPASAFEGVDVSSLRVSANSGEARR